MSKLIGYVEFKYPSWYNNKYIKTELNSSEKKYLSDLYLQKEQEFLQYLAKFTNYQIFYDRIRLEMRKIQ